MKKIIYLLTASVMIIAGCKKGNEEGSILPEEKSHFTFQNGGTYQLVSPTTVYKVPIGVTTTSGSDRNVTFTVTSPTGAVQGTHYTLSKTTALIKAGKSTDTIEVRGVQSQYLSGRRDSLVFTINDATLKPVQTNTTFKLFMRGPCFEGDTDLSALNALRGNYTRTNELFGTSAYGPYTTGISAVTLTSPTTGTITVTNIWDNGWGPITFNLDWTNPAATTAVVVAQNAIPGSNAGDINGAYAGQTVAVRPFAGQPGTYSACNSTFTLRMQLGVTGVGFFGALYTVTMLR
jgi:hypothetical protein